MSNKLISHGPAGLLRLQTMNDGPIDISSVPEDPPLPPTLNYGIFENADWLNSSIGVVDWQTATALPIGTYLVSGRVYGYCNTAANSYRFVASLGSPGLFDRFQMVAATFAGNALGDAGGFALPFATVLILTEPTFLVIRIYDMEEINFQVSPSGIVLTWLRVE